MGNDPLKLEDVFPINPPTGLDVWIWILPFFGGLFCGHRLGWVDGRRNLTRSRKQVNLNNKTTPNLTFADQCVFSPLKTWIYFFGGWFYQWPVPGGVFDLWKKDSGEIPAWLFLQWLAICFRSVCFVVVFPVCTRGKVKNYPTTFLIYED